MAGSMIVFPSYSEDKLKKKKRKLESATEISAVGKKKAKKQKLEPAAEEEDDGEESDDNEDPSTATMDEEKDSSSDGQDTHTTGKIFTRKFNGRWLCHFRFNDSVGWESHVADL